MGTPDTAERNTRPTLERISGIEARLSALQPTRDLENTTPPALDDSVSPHQTTSTAIAVAQDALAVAKETSNTLAATYQGLRLVILAAAPAIFLAVYLVWEFVLLQKSLPTLSHYYYTPAGGVFVGALVAVAAALLALSGRGAERALLYIAAFFAPLIALIPAPLTPEVVKVLGDLCTVKTCTQGAVDPFIGIGVAVWFAAGLGSVGIRLAGAIRHRDGFSRVRASVWVAIGVVVGLVALYCLVWWAAPGFFFEKAHVFSACTFLILLACTACLQGLAPWWRRRKNLPPLNESRRQRISRRITLIIGIVMLVIFIPVGVLLVPGAPTADDLRFPTLVFWVEITALALFTIFWAIQTIWKRGDPDA